MVRPVDYEYTEEDIRELLAEAERMGFSLEKGSELEKLTIRELEVLVRQVQ